MDRYSFEREYEEAVKRARAQAQAEHKEGTNGDAVPEWVADIKPVDSLPGEKDAPPVIVRGLWRQEEVLLLGGQSKSWKSWALMDLLFCIANGLGWLKWGFVNAGRVLHIDLELFAFEIRKRYELVRASYRDGSLSNIDVLSLRGKRFGMRDFEHLSTVIEAGKYSAVLFDPTYRLLAGSGMNESDPGVIIALMNTSLHIASSIKSGVGLLQHFSKGCQSEKNHLDAYSGSGVWGRAPDTCVTFRELEEEKSFQVSVSPRHWIATDPFAVEWKNFRFQLAPDKDPEDLKAKKTGRPAAYSVEKLCNLLGDDERLSWSELFRRSNLKKQTFVDYLSYAMKDELIAIDINKMYFITTKGLKRFKRNNAP